MEPVAKGATQISVIPRSKCGSDQAGVPKVFNDVAPRETARHNHSGIAGSDLKVRDEQDKLQRGIDIKSGDPVAALRDDGEPAEKSCRGIVRMPFQFRAKRAKRFLRKAALSDPVQRHQDTEPEGDTAAESAGLGHITCDG